MKLHNSNRTIMRKDEGKPEPEKAIDYFRIIYYSFLIFIVVYVSYYFLMRNIIIRGSGVVKFDTYFIQAPVSGMITDLNLTPEIQKNQFLCNIKERIIKSNSSSPSISQSYINAKLKLDNAIAQYRILKKEYYILNKDFKQKKELQSLELFNPNENYYYNIKNRLNNLKVQLSTLKEEIKIYQNLLRDIKFQSNSKSNQIVTYINTPIYAWTNGKYISGIEQNYTIVNKGDTLFKLSDFKKVTIVAYLSQKNIDYIKKGDIFYITLPNDIEKKGIVTKLDVGKFNGILKVKITLIPEDSNISFWKNYDNFKVKIRKNKW